MSVKVGNYKGEFAASDVAQGIEYAVSMGADVINMSFGSSASSSLVAQALQDALPYCVAVAAAGNNGLPTTDYPFSDYPYRHVDFLVSPENTYPAAYSYVLGVMATDKSGNLADFSNWDYLSGTNAEYEIAAPGAEIYSALPGNRYEAWSGTSMAAPIVSAAAAILRGLNPDKTEYTTRTLMGQLASASSSGNSRLLQRRDHHGDAEPLL